MATFSFFISRSYKWTQSIAAGLFLYFFLVAFLPFGVSNYNPHHEYSLKFLLEIAAFGGFTIGVSLLNEFLIKRILHEPITAKSIVAWFLWSLILLGLSLYVMYSYLGGWHDWSISGALKFVMEVSLVLVFPFAGVFFYFKYRSLQHEFNNILTTRGPSKKDMLFLKGQGSREKLTIPVKDFLYGRAQDNYVELNYLLGNEVENMLFRTTLNTLEDTSGLDYIVRCHRSFLINALAVHSIHGGKNNLSVRFEQSEIQVPVSRTYTDHVIEILKKYKQFEN